MHVVRTLLQALRATLVAGLAIAGAAHAQTVGTTIPTGSGPSYITVNPVTNKLYVTNEFSNTVTVLDGATGTGSSVAVGSRPTWIAVNPETNKVYVSNAGGGATPSLMVLNGASNTVTSTLSVGDVGWTAINQVTNKAYVIRYGYGDEVNIILDERYVNTAATRSYQPVSIALNPYTNILYIAHVATGDIVAIDARVDQSVVQDNVNNYPPLLCPNGSGGYRPSPRASDPDPGPCINVTDPVAAVTVNPVTDMIYAVSSGTSSQISVIRGSTLSNPHTVSFLSPPGVSGAAKAIAANPVSGKVYAAFANHIVVVNPGNTMTVIPASGAVAVGVNSSTNTVYVPRSDGNLLVIDGATNAVTATLSIPMGAKGVAVNPVTNMVYVISESGVTPITGAGTAVSIPLTTSITPVADPAPASGSITITASSSGGFAAPRRVYFQIDSTSGAWQAATQTGAGTYSASYSGLSNGSHTIRAFATNALDAPSIVTDVQNNPLVGMMAAYTFTVGGATPVDASISVGSSPNPSSSGQNVTLNASVSGTAGVATGTVTFRDGSTPIAGCTSLALVSGAASCVVSSLTVGSHSITAQYSGSSSYNAGTSSAITQVVKAAASVVLTSSANPSTSGTSVTFTAAVSGTSGAPSGSVDFRDGGAAIAGCTGVAIASGSAVCSTSTLAVATHSITAHYLGSATYNAASSNTVSQVVNPAPKVNANIALSSTPNPSTSGTSVTLTAAVSGSAGTATGTVDFRDGGVSISGCGAVTIASGSASCSTTTLPVGSRTLTAVYGGDSAYNGGTSNVITHAVKANASIVLGSSANPSTSGASVTFSAAISGTAGAPSGTVDFRNGATPICSAVTVTSGSATCTTSTLAVGTHSITAQYSGNGTYNAGTSNTVTQTVNTPAKVNATIALDSAPNPSVSGANVTFTAALSGGAGIPTGTIDFRDGSTSIPGCAAVAIASGAAACSTTGLAGGSRSITAVYSGNAAYNAGASDVYTQVVKGTASIAVSTSPNPSVSGGNVTLTAALSGTAGVPSGTVDFLDGASTIAGCSGIAIASGSASCSTATLAVGSHSITATYSGNASYVPGTSSAHSHVVNTPAKVDATIALSSSPNPSFSGGNVTFSATLSGSAGAPTGTVDFRDGGVSIGGCSAVVIGSGTASCSTTALPAGSRMITAHYSGDTRYNAGTSPGVTQVVNTPAKANPVVGVVSSANPSAFGQSVAFTANVSGPAGMPTGTVDFLDGGTVMTGCAGTTLSNGAATCNAASLAAGSHAITARYAGNAAYEAGTSAVLNQTVQAATPASPQVALAPSSLEFGGQSMGTTSAPLSVRVTNNGAGALTITSVSVSSGEFAQTHDCGSLAPGSFCTVQVTFAPATRNVPLNASVGVAATLSITSNASGSPHSVSLSGNAEKSLVSHYYRSIFRRAPDDGGKAYWQSESTRMANLGANVNEVWYAMATAFLSSSEYRSYGRDNGGFLTDLYQTFFNRAPDSGGYSYWLGQMGAGMPRDVVLVSFMFSPEFTNFTQGVFGNTAARVEVDTVMDMYRGFLSRLPDSGGFNYYVQQLRDAQCRDASAVYAQVVSMAQSFGGSAEYVARNRSNPEFIADLYNALLGRGGDNEGVQFWIRELDTGARTRDRVRQDFIGSPEFMNEIHDIVAQGCKR